MPVIENESLVLDLLEWAIARPRTYSDAMDAWRTSCPRLTIWEDATDAGLVELVPSDDGQKRICVTDSGREFLSEHGRRAPPP